VEIERYELKNNSILRHIPSPSSALIECNKVVETGNGTYFDEPVKALLYGSFYPQSLLKNDTKKEIAVAKPLNPKAADRSGS
jgi:hypothetical protein